MCTQFQRFVATLLLLSILLQSCGGVNWKIADDASPRGAGAKTYHLSKAKKHSKSSKLATAASFPDSSMEPKFGYAPVLSGESSGECFIGAFAEVSNTPTPVSVPSSTLLATPQRAPTSRLFHSPRPLIQTKVPRRHAAPKPRHMVLDQASMAGRVHREGDQALVLTTPSPLRAPLATDLLDASWSNTNSRHQLQPHPEAKHALKATERKGSYSKSAINNLAFQTYPTSQGHQVRFQEADGKWLAQVQDGWGREQLLPVVCANLQTPERAIQSLSSKATGQPKYWLHVLDTHQPPWPPRCVYVGYLGLRGGMEKEARKAQERIETMNASREINHVSVSVQGLQLHETADEEQFDEERQKERMKRLSERRRQKILENSANRLASIRDTHAFDQVQKKEDAKGEDTQALPPNESPTAWHPPFVAKAAPVPGIANWLQRSLQLHLPSASGGSLLTHGQVEEDTKMPSLPRVTTFTTPEEAQKAAEAYLTRWRLATLAGRAVLQEQGQVILKGVEALKKTTKCSYRRQVLGFETLDVDPFVWNRALQEQQATKVQLEALRGLRSQLLDACQLNGHELQAVGIRTIFNESEEEVLYSSDEEAQQLSDQSRRNHAAFVAGIGQALQGHIEELLALVDDAMGTTIAHYVALLSSIPELPDLLGDYVEKFLHETDEERRAELLGSLLTEVILQFVPFPKGKKSQLKGIKHKLGKAAQRVAPQRTNQLNTLVRTGKAFKSVRKFDQKK